jgi:hypothetical protein
VSFGGAEGYNCPNCMLADAVFIWLWLEWLSERTLYESAVRVFPGNCKMQHNYATTLNASLPEV